MRRNAGFTLIELNCALFVITTGLFGVLGIYSLVIDKTNSVQEAALAERAVRNEIEMLRAQPFTALEPGEARPFQSGTPRLERLKDVRAAVAVIDRSEGNAGLKEVRARVVWRGDNGRMMTKELVTLVADKGVRP